MEGDGGAPADGTPPSPPPVDHGTLTPKDPAAALGAGARPASGAPRRRLLPLVLIAGGLALTLHFSSRLPKTQHVRLELGAAAREVISVEIAYVGDAPEAARATRLTFVEGAAPRVVALDPELASGRYTLQIAIGTRQARRTVERHVTLEGGTTMVDLAAVLDDNRNPP